MLAFWGRRRGWRSDRPGFLIKTVIQNVFCKVQLVLEDMPQPPNPTGRLAQRYKPHSLSIGTAKPMVPKKAQKCENRGSPYLDKRTLGRMGGGGGQGLAGSPIHGTRAPSQHFPPFACVSRGRGGCRLGCDPRVRVGKCPWKAQLRDETFAMGSVHVLGLRMPSAAAPRPLPRRPSASALLILPCPRRSPVTIPHTHVQWAKECSRATLCSLLPAEESSTQMLTGTLRGAPP